jgi:regulator of sigma E protease
MSGFFIAIAAVAVILGFMILIHEFGHYAVAKLLGVRVEVFSIGFGKRLVGFRKGETDYRIAAIPLGGYVKMSGENPMDERTGDPREFLSHPRWHRFLIAIAGPAMNVFLAIGLLTVVFMVHYEYPVYLDKPAVIAGVRDGSPAAKAGLQPGDRIVEIAGIKDPTWDQVSPQVMLSPNQPMNITFQRGNQTFQKTIVPEPVTSSEYGSAGWYADESVTVGELEAGMPAAKAGLQDGDRIVDMDGKPVPSIDNMIERLQETKTQPVQLTVLRNGQRLHYTVTPVLAPTEDADQERYRLGFLNEPQMKVARLSFPHAFERSIEENKKTSILILQLVERLVERKVSLRTVSGPIGIAQDAGEAAQQKGWTPLLALTSALSLNLGIFNLLPIPILDGGVILFLFIESLMRRDISLRIKERVYQAAFVFLVLFAVVVIYNDIAKTLPGVRFP